jgi:hypothetical protein
MEASLLKKVVVGILLSCCLLIAACASGTATIKPYSPTSPQQEDPIFWQQWQDLRGLSG